MSVFDFICKDNLDLATRAVEVALNYKTLYVLGCIGAPLTAKNKKQYIEKNEFNSRPERAQKINDAPLGTFGFDCSCTIKALLWGWCGDSTKTYGGAKYASNGVPDLNANSIIDVCKSVSTDFSKIMVGEAVWVKGHIGIYVGNGYVVECTYRWKDGVQITAVGNIWEPEGQNIRVWTKHGKLPWITYKEGSIPLPFLQTEPEGIDVSKWNKTIDWKKVKASGKKFAILRLGVGSKSQPAPYVDPKFNEYLEGALAEGIDVGCYFFSYATDDEALQKEIDFVISEIRKYPETFTYPIYFDMETEAQTALGKERITEMITKFCDAIEKAGFYAGFYTNLNWIRNCLDMDKLSRFDLWLARWGTEVGYGGKIGMWQYSHQGSVDGISGDVDLNIVYKDYPSIIKKAKLNGFGKPLPGPLQPPVEEPPVEETPTLPIESNPIEITPEEPYDPYSGVFVRGDYVRIVNNLYYASSSMDEGFTTKSKRGKVVLVDKIGKHPYYVRAVNNAGEPCSGVLGWFDETSLIKDRVNDDSAAIYYTVKVGDSYVAIANRYGITVAQLAAWNHLKSLKRVEVGKKLRVG